ncbi:MAG: transketolase [Candidatus Staskawiczbacteria bacterium]|jgi:transketolase
MKDYKKIANDARKKVLEMVHLSGASHIGSNFSCIDVLSVLFSKLNIDKNLSKDRDRFLLSKGWAAASLYYFLSKKGVIPKEDLETYARPGSKYIGLAEPDIRGVEVAGGAMGHGLPIALGMALAAKLSEEKWKTYVLMSDGELDCGTTWESAALAAQHKLNNLTVIVDCNNFQAMGATKEVLNMEPLVDKWKAFNWDVIEINGHDYKEIEKAINYSFSSARKKPLVIIARTVKGKGVSFFEKKLEWHYKNIDKENYIKALKELNER